MPSSRKGQLLARVNFPPYTLNVLSERHILVAGGGGKSKTGVPNIIEIYELIHNGTTCRAESVLHYDTGRDVIMNSCVMHNGKHFVLAAGMGEHCQLYQMKYKILNKEEKNSPTDKNSSHPGNGDSKSEASLRRRRRSSSKHFKEDGPLMQEGSANGKEKRKSCDSNGNVLEPQIGFDVKPVESIQTDFSPNGEPYQKLVRFTSDRSVMVTAGADGHVRTWKYPELKMLYDIEAHSNEVDDLDITTSGDKIVTVSRDGHGYVWLMKNGEKAYELKYTLPKENNQKYIYRGCRFGIVEGKPTEVCLFTILNPLVRQKPPQHSYLFKWNATNFVIDKSVCLGPDSTSALAVSPDGKYVGVGTLTGTVDIYISFSLQRLYRIEKAHNIFVTGLEFLSCSEETRSITGDMDASLVSISVDNHIVVHHIPKQNTTGLVGIVIFFVIFLLFIFVLMDYLQL